MLFPCAPCPRTPPRIVVTGAGVVTAFGCGWRANADGFREGRTAFRPVTLFDVSRQRAKTAAEVDLPAELPPSRLPSTLARRADRPTRMLLLAAHEAWQQAGWISHDGLPVVLGTTSGGMSYGEDYFRGTLRRPLARSHQPTRVWQYQSQVQGRAVAEALGFDASLTIVSNACASGANALGQAWELLRRGRAARALAGGYDALSLMVFAGFDSLQALSLTGCRPFDLHRDGLALGEGAAVLALETVDSASQRGATILGELAGYATRIDLHHLTQPHPSGDTAYETMTGACAVAGLTPAQVDYVNAHGTGTQLNDQAEAAALNRWAGERVATLPVSSTKASIGHLLGGAGAVEAVVCLMALCEQWLPPETVVRTVDPACRFSIVQRPTPARLEVALSNSFGFGGSHASLVFRRWA